MIMFELVYTFRCWNSENMILLVRPPTNCNERLVQNIYEILYKINKPYLQYPNGFYYPSSVGVSHFSSKRERLSYPGSLRRCQKHHTLQQLVSLFFFPAAINFPLTTFRGIWAAAVLHGWQQYQGYRRKRMVRKC